MTDPQLNLSYGWFDTNGQEIGDECGNIHGKPLGSTDPNNPQETAYNQVINGHKYWTQTMFSNRSFAKFGVGQGCVGKAFVPAGASSPSVAQPDPNNGRLEASPNQLPADGVSTSKLTMTITKPNGDPVVGDAVSFLVHLSGTSTGTDQPNGAQCGTLSDGNSDNLTEGGMTDANGEVSVTYTASDTSARCDIVATDFESGQPVVAMIYQGAAGADKPFVTGTLPTTLTAGDPATAFTVTGTNPGGDDYDGVHQTLYLFGNNTATAGLKASQVHVSYANDSTGGTFVEMPLTGDTTDDGVIIGHTGPDAGSPLGAFTDDPTAYLISLDKTAPTTASTSKLHIEADLDQINAASGAETTLEYVDPSNTDVLAPKPVVTATPSATATATAVPTAVPTAAPGVNTTITYTYTIPTGSTAAKGCKVPKLKRKSVSGVKTKLRLAGCSKVTITRPSGKTPRHKKLVVKSFSPKAGTPIQASGIVNVTFHFVKKHKKK